MRKSGPALPPLPSSRTWQARQLYFAATTRPAAMASFDSGTEVGATSSDLMKSTSAQRSASLIESANAGMGVPSRPVVKR